MNSSSEVDTLLSRFNLPQLEDKASNLLNESERIANSKGFQSDEYISKLKEYNNAQRVITLLSSLTKKNQELNSSRELLNTPEMADLAQEEITKLEEELTSLSKELEFLTRKTLPDDEKKALLEFRPGVGGVEASLFAEELFRAYTKYAALKGLKTEVINIDYNQEGGINEAVFLVDEIDSYGLLRFESGVHRVQRVPSTEASGRIHTSTASIVVMPQIQAGEIHINPDEIRIDVFRAGGPGGQSVNTTDSAVRVTHIPTGIIVKSQNTKSQIKNKELALSILASKLQEIENEKASNSITNLREESIRGGDRSVKIRTFNFPQGRITDHRIGKSWFNITEVMGGNLDEIITEVSLELRKE